MGAGGISQQISHSLQNLYFNHTAVIYLNEHLIFLGGMGKRLGVQKTPYKTPHTNMLQYTLLTHWAAMRPTYYFFYLSNARRF
jgi:hypothetical protein